MRRMIRAGFIPLMLAAAINNGKTCRSRPTELEGGARLDVRGCIGVPLLGRSQLWLREP